MQGAGGAALSRTVSASASPAGRTASVALQQGRAGAGAGAAEQSLRVPDGGTAAADSGTVRPRPGAIRRFDAEGGVSRRGSGDSGGAWLRPLDAPGARDAAQCERDRQRAAREAEVAAMREAKEGALDRIQALSPVPAFVGITFFPSTAVSKRCRHHLVFFDCCR